MRVALSLTGLLTLCALAPFAQAQSPSWKATCESRLPPTAIEVKTAHAPIRFTHHRRVAELTGVQQLPHQGFHTLGLTEMRLGTRIDYRSPSLTHPDEPLACARPHIVVTLSLDPHVVSVASEFPEGGCAHRYIREHEMRHVKVNQHTLDDTATRMRQGLRSSFGNQVFYGTPAELENRFNRHIHGEWLPWVKAQMDQTLQLHREIDTPQEYARNRTVCNGEIARVLDAMR